MLVFTLGPLPQNTRSRSAIQGAILNHHRRNQTQQQVVPLTRTSSLLADRFRSHPRTSFISDFNHMLCTYVITKIHSVRSAPIVSQNVAFLVVSIFSTHIEKPRSVTGALPLSPPLALCLSKLLWSISAQTDERHYCHRHVPGVATIVHYCSEQAPVNDDDDDDGINGGSSTS